MRLASRKLVAIVAAALLAVGLGTGAATGARGHRAHGVVLKAAAQYLGLERGALAKDLRAGRTLAQIATARRKPVSGLKAAIIAAVKTKLDRAVAAGKVTPARAQAKLARVEKLVDRLVNLRFGARSNHRGARLYRLAAAYIEVTPKALAAELKGKSLAQLAVAHGKTVAGLKQALLAPFKARADKAVAAGRISAAQAQARLARVSARLDALIAKTG